MPGCRTAIMDPKSAATALSDRLGLRDRQPSHSCQPSMLDAFEAQLSVVPEHLVRHFEKAPVVDDISGSDGSLVDVRVDTVKVGGPDPDRHSVRGALEAGLQAPGQPPPHELGRRFDE